MLHTFPAYHRAAIAAALVAVVAAPPAGAALQLPAVRFSNAALDKQFQSDANATARACTDVNMADAAAHRSLGRTAVKSATPFWTENKAAVLNALKFHDVYEAALTTELTNLRKAEPGLTGNDALQARALDQRIVDYRAASAKEVEGQLKQLVWNVS